MNFVDTREIKIHGVLIEEIETENECIVKVNGQIFEGSYLAAIKETTEYFANKREERRKERNENRAT